MRHHIAIADSRLGGEVCPQTASVFFFADRSLRAHVPGAVPIRGELQADAIFCTEERAVGGSVPVTVEALPERLRELVRTRPAKRPRCARCRPLNGMP